MTSSTRALSIRTAVRRWALRLRRACCLRPALGDSDSWLGTIGLRTAYVSGWGAFFDYSRQYGLDAQFPLSDHGDFEDVMAFIEACRPRKVYTAFSSAKDLAKAVERRFKIKAEPLMAR